MQLSLIVWNGHEVAPVSDVADILLRPLSPTHRVLASPSHASERQYIPVARPSVGRSVDRRGSYCYRPNASAMCSETLSAAEINALSGRGLYLLVTPRAVWPSSPAIVNSVKPSSAATLA